MAQIDRIDHIHHVQKNAKTSASIPVPEAPTHTEALAMCDHLLAYLETRSHSDYSTTSRMLIPIHKFINKQ